MAFADDKDYIRLAAGDDCSVPVVSDTLLESLYDGVGGAVPCTIVKVLELRWSKAKAGASKITDFGTAVDTAEMDHIKDQIDYWSNQCPSANRITVTGLNVWRADSLQSGEPDYAVEVEDS